MEKTSELLTIEAERKADQIVYNLVFTKQAVRRRENDTAIDYLELTIKAAVECRDLLREIADLGR